MKFAYTSGLLPESSSSVSLTSLSVRCPKGGPYGQREAVCLDVSKLHVLNLDNPKARVEIVHNAVYLVVHPGCTVIVLHDKCPMYLKCVDN